MPTVLRRYAGLIRENGGTGCVTGVADLGTQAACTRVVQEAVEAFGGLDLLCNVVDLLRMHALVDVTSEDWTRLVSANLTAPFFMMQAAISHLIARNGNVVNVISRSEEHTSELQSLMRISYPVVCLKKKNTI